MNFKTNKISFCRTHADNVMEAPDKEQIINILKDKYSINFKSNRAMILSSKSLNFLRNPHLISVKTSGTNYFLFLTRINTINCAFFIDRKIKQGYSLPRIVSVKYSFDNSVFNDTLLDGELVKDTNDNWMFLISDIIVSEGNRIDNKNIITRFNTLYSILSNKYTVDKYMDICPLIVKRLFSYSEYDKLVTQFIPSMTYGIRGLYFNTMNPKHSNQLFLYPKSKSRMSPTSGIKDKITIKTEKIGSQAQTLDKIKVFEIRTTIQPEIYDLYCIDSGKFVKYDTARISTLKVSKLIRKLFNENQIVYVSCKFNSKFNKWEPFAESEREKVSDIKYIK